MARPNRRRQLLLFGLAVLLPAGVLVGLGVRVLRQESELSRTRLLDEKRRATRQLASELAARLEALKLQEINLRIRSASSPRPAGASPSNAATIFIAEISGDQVILPWEAQRAAGSARFEQFKRKGEEEEFAKQDPAAAAQAYRDALSNVQAPWESGEAQLFLARALTKAGRGEEALEVYRALLRGGGSAADEDGIPYRLYAAERLMAAGKDAAAVQSYIREEIASSHQHSPGELYVMHSIAAEKADIASLIRRSEQVKGVAKSLARVRGRVESGEAQWIAHGEEPWLLTVTPPAPPVPGLLFAVSTAKLSSPGVKLTGARAPSSEPLGPALAGLHVQWEPGRFTADGAGVNAALYTAGLALVLALTILSGYLLLRDVNRDVEMAELRSQFVANVSHELKTPLTAIRMFAETLTMGRSRDEQTRTEYLETIVSECERLARLVDNVLDFSKIEQGKKIYRMRLTSLPDVVRSAARAMQYPLSQQGFTLNLTVDEEVPALKADPDAVEQAILNLLTNAMKYSGDAREIALRLAGVNGQAVIAVEDRGEGIALEDQARIFEKYYRTKSHETSTIAGTGLGLTLVAHIARAHGGRVEVHSTPGQGSTFSISIPLEANT
jgi:signal transduction histidine kinase